MPENVSNTHQNGHSRESRLENLQPWASIIGGSALAVLGISRRSLAGAALAAAGGYLVYHGARSYSEPHAIHVQKTMTINRPAAEVYSFWRNFENLPTFMRHLKAVNVEGDRFSHWEARGPMGATVSWDAEIISEQEGHHIAWQSTPGSQIPNRGSVQFKPAPNDAGTEVTVAIQYDPPAGKLGRMVAKMFGEEPEMQIREDLRHLKQLLEAGEIPTIDGQPSGRRSAFVRMVQAAATEPKKPRSASALQPAERGLA